VNLINADLHARAKLLEETAQRFNVRVDFDTELRAARFRPIANCKLGAFVFPTSLELFQLLLVVPNFRRKPFEFLQQLKKISKRHRACL
jgi:hypothetical protein